jgi:hypothetical protein
MSPLAILRRALESRLRLLDGGVAQAILMDWRGFKAADRVANSLLPVGPAIDII